MANYLISELHFDPNISDSSLQTPFICATKSNHLEVCKFLYFESHCDIEWPDKVS
jgi:hypothetical protein